MEIAPSADGRPAAGYRCTVDHRGRRARGRDRRGRRWAAGVPGRRRRATSTGTATDELPPGCAGQVLAPWPNRIRDGSYTFGGAAPPARADRAGPAQRDPRPGQLAAVAAGASRGRPADGGDRAAAAAGLPVAAAAAHATGRSAPDGLRARHEAVNLAAEPVPVRLRHPPVPAAARRRRRRPGAAAAGPDPAAGRRAAAADRRGQGGRRRVRLHRARAGSARRCWTPRSATSSATTTAARSVTLSAPDGRRGCRSGPTRRSAGGRSSPATRCTGERHRRSVAIEPMTCPPDAFRSGRDLIALEPGQTWSGTWGIRPRR